MLDLIHPTWMLGLMLTCPAVLATPKGSITKEDFGKTTDSQAVEIFTLRNAAGAEARITNYGGTLVSLKVPDRAGKLDDVVLGFDRLEDYLKATPYFGALVGRFANRIGGAQFKLAGKTYALARNDRATNHLHGGLRGFDKAVWAARPRMTWNGPSLELAYVSQDGEEGYPGTLTVKAVYTLTQRNALRLDFTATTDKDTIVNLTNHAYFNLAGAGNGDILKHVVTIKSGQVLPMNANLLPTGEIRPVAGTPFDFTRPTEIGARINADDEQIRLTSGYGHCWVFDKGSMEGGRPALMARVYEPTRGRVLEVLSKAPGMIFYTGNRLDGTYIGKEGTPYASQSAFCMEPEHFPDAPNHPAFPSSVLRPGQTYKHTIVYRFSVRK